MSVRTGLDRLVSEDSVRALIKGRRVGLLAHPASVDSELRHARDIVEEVADLRVIFGPEHGYEGAAQDMAHVAHDGGRASDGQAAPVRIVSLYGETAADLSPRAEDLDGLDVVVIDLQDVGSRYYTYVWSAALLLRVAARVGVPTVVLDRPNPLGGVVVEGAPQGAVYRSFVGLYRVPIRHGLTMGEMLDHVVSQERIDPAALTVVEMSGWKRHMYFEDTGLPWVLPSPNMPTPDTAVVYPGGCLVEGTTLSEGRGTTRPFELIGAPGIDGRRLAAEVKAPGAILRPLTFEPTTRKFAGESCGGVQVHVTDRATFRSVELYLRLIAAMTCMRDAPQPWRTEEYEYERRRPAIDLLTGSPVYRQLVNGLKRGMDEDLEGYLGESLVLAEAFQGSIHHRY